ncbi:reprolysin-like metallopeptidase [Vulcaniibacterium thermophilum]
MDVMAAGGLVPPGATPLEVQPDFVLPPAAGTPAVASVAFGTRPSRAAAGPVASAVAAAPDPVEIDVLVVYTNDLVELRGSQAAAETEVAHLIAVANQAYEDSSTGIRFRLVGLDRVDFDPDATNDAALRAITSDTIVGVRISERRKALEADLVAMIRPYTSSRGSCGIAWLNGHEFSSNWMSPVYGYSVSNVAPCGPHVLAHELGHNLGSAHDRETQSSSGKLQYGAYPFSFGYRQSASPAFATVMAYAQYDQPWVGYFSSPELTRCGAPCGVAGLADNVRSLRANATRVAAFAGPKGTLALVDAEGLEGDADETYVPVRVFRYATPDSPTVSFRVIVDGGTATEGVDYRLASSTVLTIPAGESEATTGVFLLPDRVIEGVETIRLVLTDVTGAAVHRGAATVLVIDDDPRPVVRGRIRIPPSVSLPPSVPIPINVSNVPFPGMATTVLAYPPDYRYEVAAPRGYPVVLEPKPPSPLAGQPYAIGEVQGDRVIDLRVERGVVISGRVRFPAGSTPPQGVFVEATRAVDDTYLGATSIYAEAPEFRYEYVAPRNAWVTLSVSAEPPLAPYRWINTWVNEDIQHDILLSGRPSLAPWNTALVDPDSGVRVNSSIVLSLSAPAPPGGVRVRYRSEDGTARAGEDYEPIAGEVTIPEGSRGGYIDYAVMGDDRLEGDEYFLLHVDTADAVDNVRPLHRVRIRETPVFMSTPLPPDPAP